MKPRTIFYMAVALMTYISLLLPMVRVRAQVRPVRTARLVMPASLPEPARALLVQASLTEPPAPAIPDMPAFSAALPIPGTSAVPALPATTPGDGGFGAATGSRWHDEPAADCSDLHVRLDDEKPELQSEERTLTNAQAPVLRVHEMQNGGTQVWGWDKDTYSITACKFAIGSRSQQLLSEIKLSVDGGEVSVSGPGQHDDWTVHLLVRAPRGADVEVTAHNGPMAFYSVDGKITARTTNGPISLKDCSGEGDISAQNGPISFSGNSGKLRLHTQNGPITVALDSRWNGSELVAQAVNGPLTLRVPSHFQSSFLVESNGNSPISCHASICSEARKTWDDEHRRIEYGSGSPVIRLSTENGPISVAD